MNGDEVHRVLDALAAAGVEAGIGGGWGIDALLRRETRNHLDLDLGVDAAQVADAIDALGPLGYAVAVDERPARLELHAAQGRVDLHPIVWQPDGSGLQTGFGGRTFLYPRGSLSAAGAIGQRPVACATPELQLAFHLDYEPRDVDRLDMAALASAFGLELPPAYSGSRIRSARGPVMPQSDKDA
ncbi:MAG: lincosamide nucleotidyltransferase [Chloroflexota bacterium]|nr:lincosamide nucleotidyltransferase [Chloroflexota bacterium]